MTFDEIRFALEVNGVENEDIETLIAYCKKQGKNYEKLDDMLVELGYVKVFTDDFFGWDDADDEDFQDEYFRTVKNPHKHDWQE